MHPVQLLFGTHCLPCSISAQVLQYSCVMLHPEEELEEEELVQTGELGFV